MHLKMADTYFSNFDTMIYMKPFVFLYIIHPNLNTFRSQHTYMLESYTQLKA